MNVPKRLLRGIDPRDAEEFGFDDESDSTSVPRLIASLPPQEREVYREGRRSHVRRMTGREDVTWREYMDGGAA